MGPNIHEHIVRWSPKLWRAEKEADTKGGAEQ